MFCGGAPSAAALHHDLFRPAASRRRLSPSGNGDLFQHAGKIIDVHQGWPSASAALPNLGPGNTPQLDCNASCRLSRGSVGLINKAWHPVNLLASRNAPSATRLPRRSGRCRRLPVARFSVMPLASPHQACRWDHSISSLTASRLAHSSALHKLF